MIKSLEIAVTTAGSDGSAVGAANSSRPINGKVQAIWFDFHASAPNTTDVTVTERVVTTDRQTVCVETSSKTDVMRYPRRAVEDNAEGTVTYDGTNEIYEPYVIDGYIRVAVAQCNALTNAVVVTVLYDE